MRLWCVLRLRPFKPWNWLGPSAPATTQQRPFGSRKPKVKVILALNDDDDKINELMVNNNLVDGSSTQLSHHSRRVVSEAIRKARHVHLRLNGLWWTCYYEAQVHFSESFRHVLHQKRIGQVNSLRTPKWHVMMGIMSTQDTHLRVRFDPMLCAGLCLKYSKVWIELEIGWIIEVLYLDSERCWTDAMCENLGWMESTQLWSTYGHRRYQLNQTLKRKHCAVTVCYCYITTM